MTKTQDALRSLFRIEHDRAGNLPPLPSILPDAPAPLVRVDHDRARAFSPSYS